MTRTSSILVCAVAAVALSACGDDGGSTSGAGGSGGDGPGTGAGGAASGSTSSSTTVSSASSASSVSTGTGGGGTGGAGTGGGGTGGGGTGGTGGGGTGGEGGSGGGFVFTECEEPVPLFADVDLDACANASCCDQITLCAGDTTLCFDDFGNIDESLPGGDDLYECVYRASCIGSPVCTSGIGFGDDPAPETLEFAYCLDQNCCEEMNFCTGSGDDPQGCIDCLNGLAADFEACEPVNGCALESCDAALIFVPICESGLGTSSPSVGQCLDTNCCEEYLACTGGEDNAQGIQECIDCLLDGGGALCDAALECEAASCSTAICDSGLVIDDVDLAACLTESCCDEYTACTGDGSAEDVQACIDCFDAEGGELCDDAIACGEVSCPEE